MISVKKTLIWIVIHTTFFLIPAFALADVGQLDGSLSSSAAVNENYVQKLGTGYSGTISAIEASIDASAGSGGMAYEIEGFTDGTYTTGNGDLCQMDNIVTISGAGVRKFTDVRVATGGGCTLNPAAYYSLHIARLSGGATLTAVYGSPVQLYSLPQMELVTINSGTFDATVYNPYLNLYGVSGGGLPSTDADTTTHIVSFSPEEGTTTGNSVDFNLHVYINPDDLSTFLGVQLDYQNIDQNTLLSNVPFVSNDSVIFAGQATTSGDFYFNATALLPDGNYRVQASIKRTLVGTFINPLSHINETQNHQFVVNQGSYIGNLNQNGFNEFNAILGSSTATTTAAAAKNCNPLTFEINKCLAFLFIPGGAQLDTSIKGFRDGIATRWPWGYFYRVYAIMTNPATSTLPMISTAIVVGAPGALATTTLTYDPGEMLNGATDLLATVKDNQHGLTLREIMEPFVQLMIALAVVFTIFTDLTGSHSHAPEGGGMGSGGYKSRRSGFTVSDNRRGIDYEL